MDLNFQAKFKTVEPRLLFLFYNQIVMVKTITTPPPVEQALDALRYLARESVARPLIHDLVSRDVARWEWLDEGEKRTALERALRRVGALCPWTKSKRRVRAAARMYGIAL